MLSGCHVPKPKPKDKDTGPAISKEVATNEPVTSTFRDKQGFLVWEVTSAATTMVIGEAGSNQVTLVGVAGKFYKVVEGKPDKVSELASTFKSETGHADQVLKVLVLEGKVRVTDEKQGLLLMADKITYRQDSERIEAEGHVTVSSSAYEAGEFDKLWATPDLRKVGTPDAFLKGAKR